MAHTGETLSATPAAALMLEANNRRLQTLVVELLATNETLRFKVAELETRTKALEQCLAASCATAGALWP